MQTPKVKDEWIVELRLARLVSFANFTFLQSLYGPRLTPSVVNF